jgi:pilus assembly protein FimV
MRLRQLVLACGLTSLVLSPYVSALGLGEVKLKSTLNQPLEAEVKLLDTRDLTAEQILVALASPADFERNGVDRLFFYTEFQFQVDLTAADGPKVVITSRSPVREPYLNFLIEARWTAGRLLREYTLLMDLPTFDEERPTPVVQRAVTQTTQQRAATSSPRSATSSGFTGESRQPARQPSLSGDEYQVRNNDTLWEIALRARPDSSVSVHQSMMALYRANPEAFINGNINRLRRGQVLRVPDASEMKSLNRSEAVSQFAQATGDSDLGAQLNASRRTSAARTESTEVSGRVKLAAPSSGAAGSGQGSGANDGAGKALESELAVTLEELDKSKAENTELSSRVKDLEAQIETMERLVEVSNEKLRALQVSAEQSATVSPETQISEPPVAVVEPVTDVAAVAISEAAASSVAAMVPPQPTPPKKVIVPPKPEPTLADIAIENAPWIGLGVLGLAGAGYFAYRRRKQAEEEQAEDLDHDAFAMDDSVHEHEAVADDTNRLNESDEISLFNESNETTAVAETGDVVGEADIYIAYGKLDQAEEMLLNGLQKDPDSADIRMKLLEVYSQQQNASAFDKHYAALLPLAGGVLLARASELRAGIADAGEFDPAPAVASQADNADVDQFSLDDFNLDDDSSTAPTAVASDSTNFDFDLDLDDDELNPAQAMTDTPTKEVGEFELDLDDDLTVESEADDLSELVFALDSIETETLAEDVEAKAPSIDHEFNFELDDDFELGELAKESSTELVPEEPESLDVSEDDFNLDMDVDDVDLAALDHEMESLDVDFDEDLLDAGLLSEGGSIVKSADDEFALDLEGDVELSSAEPLRDDISPSKLSLTDDLDLSEASTDFELDEDLADFGVEDTAEKQVVDLDDDNGAFAEVSADESLPGFEPEDDDTFSLEDEALADSDFDLAALESDLGELSEFTEPADAELTVDDDLIDLELQDEIPSQSEAAQASPLVIADEFDLVSGEEELDEDLFAQALSDFSGESDEIDLNEFSSDEAALADLSDDDMDAELDFLADADEAATKLDLARAYIDMGDSEGAKDILSEVLGEGTDDQRKEANELLGRIG